MEPASRRPLSVYARAGIQQPRDAMNQGLVCGLIATSLTVSACASEPATKSGGSMARFDAGVEECKRAYGYDPDALPDLGEHSLAPNERKTRACVYDAIRTTVIPMTEIPEKYEALITTDEDLTDGIENGTMTRDQRRTKIEALIAEIESLESARAKEFERALEAERRRTEFTRGMVEMMR